MHHESDTEPPADTGGDTDTDTGTGGDAGTRTGSGVPPGVERGGAAVTAPRQVSVVVDGELDLATVPRLLELSRVALEGDAPVVVLDLSAVEFVDCSGLRGLVAARALLLAAGRAVTVPRPSPAVSRLLSWTSMTEHFAPDPAAHP